MSTVKVCDKCGRTITPKHDESTRTSSWEGYHEYNIIPTKKELKINKQFLQVCVTLKLACGDSFDLCHDCGFKVINHYLKDK